MQDAYVRALRAFGAFRGPNFKPWLLTIVRNVAYRRLTSRQRASNVIPIHDAFVPREDGDGPLLSIASPEPSAEAVLIGSETNEQVRQALGQLPAIFREVLVLREIEDLSYAEIARITDTPPGTVMSRLSRARTALRVAFLRITTETTRNAV